MTNHHPRRGSEPLPDGGNMKTMTIMVRDMPRDLWLRLKAEAALHGKPMKEVLTDLIRKHLDRQ